jgi:hypothetical protein
MKILGWILFFSMSSAFAQQVIEPAPLSIEDDGSRRIIDNPSGKPLPKAEDKAQVVNPPPATELAAPNDEVLNPPSSTSANKKAKSKNKKIAAKPKAVPVVKNESPAPQVNIEVKPVIINNPQDGQLKLEKTTQATPVVSEQVVQPAEAPVINATLPVEYYDAFLGKYIQFSFGYINSRYEKIHSTLDNGSTQTAIKFASDINSKLQTGFAVEFLTDTSGQSIPDNIRVVQYRLFADYHKPVFQMRSTRFDWVGGLSFSIGEYGIKRRYRNLQGEEVSVKIKSGTIVGLIPAAGIRVYILDKNSFDIMVEYHQYFGNPQKYIGGLAIAPRINFQF